MAFTNGDDARGQLLPLLPALYYIVYGCRFKEWQNHSSSRGLPVYRLPTHLGGNCMGTGFSLLAGLPAYITYIALAAAFYT